MSQPASRIVALPALSATEALAGCIAAMARPGDCILLDGPLGAGKTAFARAFLRAAADDPALEVPSPSFTLVQIYETRIGPVFHYDLWRLDGSASLTELDWDAALDAVVLVEWPDRLGSLRPEDALAIGFRLGEGEAREATLTGWDSRLPGVLSWTGDGTSEVGLVRPPGTLPQPAPHVVAGRAKPGHDTKPGHVTKHDTKSGHDTSGHDINE